MTEQKQEEVRDYLYSWMDQDWTLLDDLLNDGMSLPTALVTVHRSKVFECPAPVVESMAVIGATEQPELMLV
jgi:hypothetical protein